METKYEKPGRIIDLSSLALERHVHKAFRTAKALAQDEPINALHLATAAVVVVGDLGSSAFEFLSSRLTNLESVTVDDEQLPPEDEKSFLFSVGIARSFVAARPALQDSRTVWGRDYVTLVLLAGADETLEQVARGAGSSLDDLRADWFRYAAASDRHRTADEWRAWWANAKVPFPELSDGVEQKQAEDVSTLTTTTYLFTWNPDRFPWDDLEELIADIRTQGAATQGWSTGQRTHVNVGDRVFLMRQGSEPRGLVGAGRIAGEVQEVPHWDPKQRQGGRTYNVVDVRWEWLAREPILNLPELERETGEKSLWRSQVGGVEIRPKVARLLEDAWDNELLGYLEEQHPPDIARVVADSVLSTAVDHLNVEREAKAFARVAASEGTTPPLSVGVFGEWGSGKTFFMEKMFAHVERLQEVATESITTGAATAYHPDIVQIRFNAWHYMEANLWASLVEHIFQELDNWLRPKEEGQKIDALFARLATARNLKLEEAIRLIDARRRQKEAQVHLEKARAACAVTDDRRQSVSRADFWAAVGETFTTPIPDDEQNLLDRSARALGFVDAGDSARELMSALDQVRVQAHEGQLLLKAVFGRLRSVGWAAALVGLLILVPRFLPELIELIPGAAGLFGDATDQVLKIGAGLATIAGWVGVATGFARKAMRRLREFKGRLDTKLAERTSEDPQPILQAEQVLARQLQEVEVAESRLQKSIEQVLESGAEFQDSARSRLNRFIRDKLTGGDYAQHLGIIATIRKDFSQLAKIMSEARNEHSQKQNCEVENENVAYREKIKSLGLDELVEDGLLTTDEREAIDDSATLDQEEPPFFQRIILYIDDLDRCPPGKVVEVLQACHLLLCFPLFIVVVAVDARWVSRALLTRYEGLLDDHINGSGGDDPAREASLEGTASPRDYLEKIFQIPYWVQRMQGDASSSYAKELVGPVVDREAGGAAGGSRANDVNGGPVARRKPDVETVDPAVGDAAAAGVADDDTQAVNDDPASDPDRRDDQRDPDEPDDQDDSKDNVVWVEPNPESLRLTTHERDFLSQLAPYAGRSPRTIKRFVNVYRLLRTGLSQETLSGLVGEKGNSSTYRAIIAQLAIVTGAPSLACRYFEILGPPQEADDGMTPTTLLTGLKTNQEFTDAGEWSVVQACLAAVKELDDSNGMIDEMRQYAAVVRRYSFSARSYL